MGTVLMRRIVSVTGQVVGAYARRLDPESPSGANDDEQHESEPSGLSDLEACRYGTAVFQKMMDRDFDFGTPRWYGSLKSALNDPLLRHHEVVYGDDLVVRAMLREVN